MVGTMGIMAQMGSGDSVILRFRGAYQELQGPLRNNFGCFESGRFVFNGLFAVIHGG